MLRDYNNNVFFIWSNCKISTWLWWSGYYYFPI